MHRDVKPGNLLRTADGIVKLADFGIARATDQSSITQVGSVLGTAAYLAPEQAAGEEAGPQADLYSLGVVTYQCLAGRLPYEAASLSELALKQQREVPPTLDRLRGDVGPALASAVAVALSIHPRARYESARAMGEALDRAAEGIAPEEATAATSFMGGTEATSVLGAHDRGGGTSEQPRVVPREPVNRRRAAPAAAPVAAGTRSAARGRPSKRRRRRRTLAVLLVLALIGAGVGIAIVTSMSDSQRVQLRRVVYDSVQQSVDAMKQLVSDNTK